MLGQEGKREAGKAQGKEVVGHKALVVMMKYPAAGEVKTRLVPPLTHSQACGLYGCFLRDIFAALPSLTDTDIWAAYAPVTAQKEVRALVPGGFGIFAQEGADLGERMRNAFSRLFSQYEKVSMIGTDSPDLPVSLISDSFEKLDKADAVFGPAEDGGYYLIALKNPVDALFKGIKWGSSSVLADSLEKARQEGISTSLLDPWHDIDRPEDLKYLRGSNSAPESSAFLRKLAL